MLSGHYEILPNNNKMCLLIQVLYFIEGEGFFWGGEMEGGTIFFDKTTTVKKLNDHLLVLVRGTLFSSSSASSSASASSCKNSVSLLATLK